MEKENHGLNELYKYAYSNPDPYEDRLRSTNVKEFTRDTTLDNKDFVDVARFELAIGTV